MAKKGSIGANIALDGEKEFRAAITNINSSMKVLTSEMKKVSAEFSDNKNSVTALTSQNQVLNKQIEQQRQKVETLKKALENSKNQYGENDKKTKAWQVSLNNAEADLIKLNKEVTDNEKALEEAGNATGKMSKGLKDVGNNAGDAEKKTLTFSSVLKANLLSSAIIGGIKKLGSALNEMAKDTVGFAMDSQTAFNKLISKTGATEAEFADLKDTMNNIYASNFGEDMQDVASALATVKQQTGLAGDALEDTTKQAITMRDTFDFEVTESIRAANMLMTTFGVSSEEAFNLIAQGAQGGLDKDGDMLDSLNEYSVHFQNLGLDAENMFNMLKNGAKGGAFSIDKLGDAAKEFGIKVKDGSADEAFKELGLSVDETKAKFGEGGEAAKKAFQDVASALFSVKDPIAQNNLGVQMFGTMWEDLGAKGVKAMTDIDGNISTTSKSLENINNTRYDDIGSAMEGLGRTIKTKVVEQLEEKLLPTIKDLIKQVENNAPKIISSIEDIAKKITSVVTFITDNKEGVIAAIVGITTVIGLWKAAILAVTIAEQAHNIAKLASVASTVASTVALGASTAATGIATAAQWALNAALSANPIGIIITLVAGLVAALVILWNKNEGFRNAVINIFNTLKNVISGFVEGVKGFFGAIVNFVKSNWKQLLLLIVNPFAGAFALVYKHNAKFRKAVDDLVKKVKKLIVNMATGMINAVKTLPSKFFNTGKNIVKFLWNGISGLVSWALGKLGGFATSIINKVTSGVKGIVGVGKNIVKGLWDGISGLVSWIYEKVSGFAGTVISNISSGVTGIADVGKNLIQGLWNGINNMASWIRDKIQGFGKGVLDNLKNFFGIHSPSTVFRDEIGKYLAQGLGIGFTNEMDGITKDINKSIPTDFEMSATYQTTKIQKNLVSDTSVEGLYNLVSSAVSTALSTQTKDTELIDYTKIGKAVGNEVAKINFGISLNDREFARGMKEMGVAFK
ncbi:phage tail tape measure protein [Anaerosacchariphilus polymeriproducens]|uniref:Phage tail tape measure protein domain-containing protein n=1 Tax=Anaerosacchariphilus polymeriproducens TaxID=1812858 RepID=A0A371AT56_9FIRM|nr:phage tail tape measure protein [Anaerosacchariphilus polymeriproducens]RDU22757.1 hypothetical protein DWV06_13390 [Anaerosacchariphilus polymeriproducens]